MKKFTITEITEWEIDETSLAVDCDHMGDNYHRALADAEDVKECRETEGGKGLPFTCKAETIDEALEKYNNAFYADLDYVNAVSAEYDEAELKKFSVSLQVDCRVDIEVYAETFDEAFVKAQNTDFDNSRLECIETHCVNATDEDGNFADYKY